MPSGRILSNDITLIYIHTIPTGYPMQVVAVDILGPLPEMPSENKYPSCSGLLHLMGLSIWDAKRGDSYGGNQTYRRNVPSVLPLCLTHSDQGTQFESNVMTNAYRLLNIRKTRTTAYHPQGGSLVEHFNRTLLAMLATCAQQHPSTWEMLLQNVCFAHNSSEHPSTGYSPFYLMFGREGRLPVELRLGPSPTDDLSPPNYAKELQSLLCGAYKRVRTHLNISHGRQRLCMTSVSMGGHTKHALLLASETTSASRPCSRGNFTSHGMDHI